MKWPNDLNILFQHRQHADFEARGSGYLRQQR